MGPHDCCAPFVARSARSKEVLLPLKWKLRLYMSPWKLSLQQRRLASSLQRRGAVGLTTSTSLRAFPCSEPLCNPRVDFRFDPAGRSFAEFDRRRKPALLR